MVPWGFVKRHALKEWDKQRDKGGVVLVPYESGPESDPAVRVFRGVLAGAGEVDSRRCVSAALRFPVG